MKKIKTKKYLNYLKYILDDSGPHEPACCEVYSFLESFFQTYDCVGMKHAELRKLETLSSSFLSGTRSV